MGTKVQCKSYFPGYYSMRDLNEEANSGRWSFYYEDKVSKSRQYYNSFLPRPTTNGYSDYDKEVLKKMMLEHESIFKSQVSELHRLYRIQRELMDDYKRKQLHNYPTPVEESKSNLLSSQIPSEVSQKMRHIPLASSAHRPSVSGSDNMQSPLNFIKDSSMLSDTIPTQNGGSFKDGAEFKKLPRRTFDLQLPADEYIDSEEEEWIKEEKVSQESVSASFPLKKNCVAAPDSGVKLSLGSGGNPGCQGDASQSDSCLRNKYCLADLNDPIEVEKATSSAPDNNFLGSSACHWGFQGQDMPGKPNPDFVGLPKEFFQNTQKVRDKGTHINILHSENAGSKREWLFHNHEAGQTRSKLNVFSQDFCPEASSKPIEGLKKAPELPAFPLADQSKREPGRESAIYGIGISKGSQGLSNYNSPRPVEASCIRSPYPVVPPSPVANFGSPWVSSSINLMSCLNQNPIAAQARPFYNTSVQMSESSKMSNQSSGLRVDKEHLSSNLRSNSSFGSEVSYQNGFCQGLQSESNAVLVHFHPVGFEYRNCGSSNNLVPEHFENQSPAKYFKDSECMDVKSAKDINLNLALPNGFPEGMVAQRDVLILDEGKNEDPLGGLPWQRTKLASDDGPSKGSGSSKQGIEVGNSLFNKKILGFSVFEEPHFSKNQSSASCSSKLPSEAEVIHSSGKAVVLYTDLSQDPIPNLGQQLYTQNLAVVKELDKDLSGFRNHINLNSFADEEEAPSARTNPRATVKIISEIDLEAPVVPETAEGIAPGGEFLGNYEFLRNQLEAPVISSQVEEQDPSEELIRIVAEAIVIISSSGVENQLGDDTCEPSEASLRDSLLWFAEVILSYTVDSKDVVLKEKRSGDCEKSFSDGTDYFESMTLKLTETKVDEYWRKPWAPDSHKEEETCAASLPTRRRKGQARRGRQRRDFQRDILPGLASLSRHEVTEDLQMIGGLMRATGHHWQTGLGRRNAARNGWARGRRRSQGPVATVAARVECSPPRQQPDNSDLGLEERSLKGWGKTTRRPRRQRFAVSNPPPLPVTQV